MYVANKSSPVPAVYLIHENDQWLEPLVEAMNDLGIPFDTLHMNEQQLDFATTPPPGVYYSRMSASSHTRGHRSAPELTVGYLEWLGAHDVDVVNAAHVLDLEISKARQYAKLQACGVAVPESIFVTRLEDISPAAASIGYPVVVKPNRGGKGLGVTRFDDSVQLERALRELSADAAGNLWGPDGIALVQRYVRPASGRITRAEFVGGKHLYSVSVDTAGGFELCPAEACIVDLACPVGSGAEGPSSGDDAGGFVILESDEQPELIAKFERFLAVNGIDIAGIEYLVDSAGDAWTYDVNTNTNYNPRAERNAGLADTDGAGMRAVARHLFERLSARYSQTTEQVRGAAA
jgi:hypothetical protein